MAKLIRARHGAYLGDRLRAPEFREALTVAGANAVQRNLGDAASRIPAVLAGTAHPDTLIYLRVRDVDAIAAEFGARTAAAPWARETVRP